MPKGGWANSVEGWSARELSLRKAFEVCLELTPAHYGDQRPPRKRGTLGSTPATYASPFSFSGPQGLFGAPKTKLACGFLGETSPLVAQRRALLEAVAYILRVFPTLSLPWLFD